MPQIPKITNPAKQVTDPVVLRELTKQGIDRDYVEFFEDYSPAHPSAKFYRDLKSNKRIAVFSASPRVTKDGKKIIPQWKKSPDGTYHADTNAFSASVESKRVNISKDGKASSWSPQVFLNGIEVLCDPKPLLIDDPDNKNYKRNILEWDYGFCKRQLRLAHGAILENYILTHHPDYKEGMVVKGECNRCGKCDAGCVFQNEDGTCSVYDKRKEMGYLDCIKYPDVDDLLANTAPAECSYWIEYQGQRFEPRNVELIIKSNLKGDIKFNRPWCSEGVLQVVGDEKRFSFNWKIDDKPRVWHYPLIIDDSATFYSTTSDGIVGYTAVADWDTCHDALTGDYVNDSVAGGQAAMVAEWYARYTWYNIYRSFFYFDTSSLGAGATVTAVTFSLYGAEKQESDVCAMKGTQADPLTDADFDSFTGSEYGHVSWATEQYNNIVFNAQGRADIEIEGITKICAREYTHDYLDASPGTSPYRNGCYYAEETGTDKDPKLVVTGTGFIPPITEKNVSDTGSGVDAAPSIAVSLSLAETGSGVDAVPALSPTIPAIPDEGLGTDLIAAIEAALTLAETGSGVDAVGVLYYITFVNISDVGEGADVISLAITIPPIEDSGVGVDKILGEYTKVIADQMYSSEWLGVAASMILSELAEGADNVAVQVTPIIADTGQGLDSVVINASLNVAEVGSGQEAITITATIPIAETGAGVDAALAAVSITIADTGQGIDAILKRVLQLVKMLVLTRSKARMTVQTRNKARITIQLRGGGKE